MKTWNKKEVPREDVLALHNKYGVDALTASILCRRGITSGKDLMWFLENDFRFCHNPFEFTQMEDAVDRILAAKEEGEKVLIFGDRDVDGITATTVLYQQLKRMGIDVSRRLPAGDDAYGLSVQAVDDFAKNYGSLLITVDCGISNNEAVRHANELGISVIITDHHEAPENLPEADIIVNPKCKDSGYTFKDISGCAVAFKLAEALRFAKTEIYKQQICLMNVIPSEENSSEITVECVKLRNLVRRKKFSRTFRTGETSIAQSGLAEFLRGEQIFVWDKKTSASLLAQVFGSGVEFNMFDIREVASRIIPSLAGVSLEKLKSLSKIARYNPDATSDLDAFFNIFVTYINKKTEQAFPKNREFREKDLQLVMLAVLSDIMPLKDENRIFVRNGLDSINAGRARSGLVELLARQSLLGKKINAHDLGWNVLPVLNAAGRLGTPEQSLNLFLEESPDECDNLASIILDMNEQRKELENNAIDYLGGRPEKQAEKYGGKFCPVFDEKLNRGVIGRIAAVISQRIKAPAIAMTRVGDVFIGSMRSTRGVHCVEFLDKFGDIYINHGGHEGAAGFSLTAQNFEIFKSRFAAAVDTIQLGPDDTEIVDIDAELSPKYLTAGLMQLIDRFEPYGCENRELVFMTKNARIVNAQIMGKTQRTHLKLWLQIGNIKWPALWWGQAEKLGKEFNVGDCIDFLYNYQRNTFNGHEERQLIIVDAVKCR